MKSPSSDNWLFESDKEDVGKETPDKCAECVCFTCTHLTSVGGICYDWCTICMDHSFRAGSVCEAYTSGELKDAHTPF